MASIHKEIVINADPEYVWRAIRDVAVPHLRLARGFVVSTEVNDDARIVTFANGLMAKELIVDIDEAIRRLAYASVGGILAHHHATMQVFAERNGRTRVVWITDFLPDAAAERVNQLVEAGSKAIRKTLEETREGSLRTPIASH